MLEIAIGDSAIANGVFADILAAGGSFIANGYNGTITDVGDSQSGESPLDGRQAWTGSSAGFATTIVGLPPSASGTNIQLRWICGTDGGNADLVGAGGWWIDTIAIAQVGFDCSSCPPPGFAIHDYHHLAAGLGQRPGAA